MTVIAQTGDRIVDVERTIELTDMVRWAGASGDFARIHFDSEYAMKVANLPGAIVHGPYKMAILSNQLIEWAGGDPATLKKLDVKFVAMDLVGSTLRFIADITSVTPDFYEVSVQVLGVSSEKPSLVGSARVGRERSC